MICTNLRIKKAGFENIHIDVVTKEGTGVAAEDAAKGLLLGTPAYNLIAAKGAAISTLIETATTAIAQKFGEKIIKTELNALVCKANCATTISGLPVTLR